VLINIQFLRFFAALMVVLFHASAHLRASGHAVSGLFMFGQSVGFAGVDVFFVISGFIMAWTTKDAAGVRDASLFARRRVSRIYSGYWPFFLIALGYFSFLGGNYLANAQLVRSALLWPADLRNLLLPVSWTLIYEMVFYLLFAIIIAVNGERRNSIIKGVMIAVVAWSLYSHFGRQAYDPGILESMNVYEQYAAFPFILEFLSGSILAEWLRKHPQGLAWSLLLTGILLLAAGGWINNNLFAGKLIQGYFIIWRVLVFGSASLFILAGLVRLENRGWTFARRFSLLAGGASYALYLSHTLILDATQKLGFNYWLRSFPDWLAQFAFIGLAVLIVLYSMAHFRWVERPLHRLFRRWLNA
jgi:exopolysaccharide production protein ExoZ